jgi:hypothetical protein
MPTINPNTPIRTALIAALNRIAPVYVKKVPKSVTTIPNQYILINSQTKDPAERSKCGFEWLCTVNIEMVNLNTSGYANPIKNDEVEALVIEAIEAGLTIADFDNKEWLFINSIDLDVETPSQSIERRILTYSFWLQQVST